MSCYAWRYIRLYTIPPMVVEKHVIATLLELLKAISMIHLTHLLYILLYKLIVECLWLDWVGWELINSHDTEAFVCQLNRVRGVGTKMYGLDHVFPLDDLWFSSDTNTNHKVIQNMYLNV